MAYQLYCEFMDMDAPDYTETMQADIDFIQAIIDEAGADYARQFLEQFFE